MWISKKMWQYINRRIEKCERLVKEQEEQTGIAIRIMAKRILEQPEELHEEIKGLESIERLVDDFIRS